MNNADSSESEAVSGKVATRLGKSAFKRDSLLNAHQNNASRHFNLSHFSGELTPFLTDQLFVLVYQITGYNRMENSRHYRALISMHSVER